MTEVLKGKKFPFDIKYKGKEEDIINKEKREPILFTPNTWYTHDYHKKPSSSLQSLNIYILANYKVKLEGRI